MKLVLGMEVGLSTGDFVLDGDPAPSPKRGRSPAPQFSAHFYCGQTAGCIKMPIGMEVGLGLRDIVFDVDQLPPEKRAHPLPTPTQFLAHVYCAKWLHESRCHLV